MELSYAFLLFMCIIGLLDILIKLKMHELSTSPKTSGMTLSKYFVYKYLWLINFMLHASLFILLFMKSQTILFKVICFFIADTYMFFTFFINIHNKSIKSLLKNRNSFKKSVDKIYYLIIFVVLVTISNQIYIMHLLKLH